MRYRHLLQMMMEPQLITPAAHSSILSLLMDMPKREGQDICGEKVELPSMSVVDGIAIVPVSGAMGSKLSGMEKGSGAVDFDDIIRDVDFSNQSEEIKAILLDIDSPGGMYQGTPELGDALKASIKPIFSFSSGMICSAAYWTAASTQAIFATRSASIGSIGVYCAMLDQTGYLESMGLRVEMFASDKYKGAGTPGVPLTMEQRNLIQARVDRMAGEFKRHVTEMRGAVPRDAMLGQAFLASEAQDNNLIDAIVTNKAEAIALVREIIS
jgi:signal peptide peptidase SppA